MQKYWFKRRRYGYGWTPASKEGWALLAGLLAYIGIGAAITVAIATPAVVIVYNILLVILVAIFIAISIIKGPAPRFRWGRSPHDNPHEDF